MINLNWFRKKSKIKILSKKVEKLEEKYRGALEDIKRLEEESIETTNILYELMENIRAVDARIDILASEPINLQNYDLDK